MGLIWQRSRTERILHHALRRFVAAANGIRFSVLGNIGETGAVIQCNFNGIAPRRSNVLKWFVVSQNCTDGDSGRADSPMLDQEVYVIIEHSASEVKP